MFVGINLLPNTLSSSLECYLIHCSQTNMGVEEKEKVQEKLWGYN